MRCPRPVPLLLLAAAACAVEIEIPVGADGARTERWQVALDAVGVDGVVQPLAKAADAGSLRAVLRERAGVAVARDASGRTALVTRLVLARRQPGMSADEQAARHGLALEAAPAWARDWCVLRAEGDALAAVDAAARMRAAGVLAAPLLARQRTPKADPSDPLLPTQWHLRNTAQVPGAVAGNDINLAPIWDPATGWHGDGVNIAIVDTGVDTGHPDLAANARTAIDVDLNDEDGDPRPAPTPADQAHGTMVAGLAAARSDDGIGVAGVAGRAGIIGVRLLAAPTTDADEATALAWRADDADAATQVWVSNNSWGVSDDGSTLGLPGPLLSAAIAHGAEVGRGGRGIIYVWAGGNGGGAVGPVGRDNASYDAFVGNRYAIGVGASDAAGERAPYSETGCGLLLNAPGGLVAGPSLVSTDAVGANGFEPGDHTLEDGGPAGTSFAAPLVAGVCALALQRRPQLGWRDVQHVLVATAARNDPGDAGWTANGSGRFFSHAYGFGRVDAAAAVGLAATWTLAPPEVAAVGVALSPADAGGALADGGSRVFRMRVDAPADLRVERVEWTVELAHGRRGDVSFALTSPTGGVSRVPRRPLDTVADLHGWPFSSVAHWGESAAGTWQLAVNDEVAGVSGSLVGWSLRIHGWRPYAAPTLLATVPDGIDPGSGDVVLTLSGSGFTTDGSGLSTMTAVTWNGAPVGATVIAPDRIQVAIPAATIVGGSGTLAASNPAFLGEGGGAATPLTVPIEFAPTISAIADQRVGINQRASEIAFTVADVETAAAALQVTASAVDANLLPATGIRLGGSGATRTLSLAPRHFAAGQTTVRVVVSDGQRATARTFTLTVVADDDGDCGLGGVIGALLALGFGWCRRFRPRAPRTR